MNYEAWEYKKVQYVSDGDLNELGKEGWELTAISTWRGTGAYGTLYETFYFKRRYVREPGYRDNLSIK